MRRPSFRLQSVSLTRLKEPFRSTGKYSLYKCHIVSIELRNKEYRNDRTNKQAQMAKGFSTGKGGQTWENTWGKVEPLPE